jgi:hypothetical protein
MINWHLATKEQLFTILSEDCPIDYKYKACSMLLYKRNLEKADYLQEIVYLFGSGLLVPKIAEILSVSHQHVEKTINQKRLWTSRLHSELYGRKKVYVD